MTILDRVTLTGADDSIHPYRLQDLSAKFPFVEWGILVSHTVWKTGQAYNRFPSRAWFENLQDSQNSAKINLSLHICGTWVRKILIGYNQVPPELFDGFQRVQLNFHGENAKIDFEKLKTLIQVSGRQHIFQIDHNKGHSHYTGVLKAGDAAAVDVVPLFDVSGGAGILPKSWPKPITTTYQGYAGGLGPQNLEVELPKILEAGSGARIWIDMETHVRSHQDRQFDLDKVEEVLEYAKPYIK